MSLKEAYTSYSLGNAERKIEARLVQSKCVRGDTKSVKGTVIRLAVGVDLV